jgi:hypothetical protein
MVAKGHKITINVPLFKKLWDIIFFFGKLIVIFLIFSKVLYCQQANHIGSNLVRTFPAFCNNQGIRLIGKLSVDNTARL